MPKPVVGITGIWPRWLDSGEAKYSDYMRPGFEFLQQLIDHGYIDPEKALISEAIEGEGPDFLAGKTPIVMAYWGAANAETAYGRPAVVQIGVGLGEDEGLQPPAVGPHRGLNPILLEHPAALQKLLRRLRQLQLVGSAAIWTICTCSTRTPSWRWAPRAR